MQKHIMVDIETTGTDINRDQILQVGMLELEFLMGAWRPGKSLEFEVHTTRRPESQFARENQSELFEKCRATLPVGAPAIRQSLQRFFRSCGLQPPEVYLMGWNASGFDVPFLVKAGFLEPHRYVQDMYGKDFAEGDFHYRIYEMAGALAVAENALGMDRKELQQAALAADSIIPLPAGKAHDALYDCYRQAKMLNGLITLLRGKA